MNYGRKPRFHGGTQCKAAANLLDRQFDVTEPDTAWASDFTFIRTHEGWMYLAVVIDLFSRQVVGWAMRDRADTELVVQALLSAVWRRKPASGCLVHSDQGSVYTSDDRRSFLASNGLVCSMSRRGNCHDNDPVESFFGLSNASGSGGGSIPPRTPLAPRYSTTSRCSTTPNAVMVQLAICRL
ncbi:putative transposase [Xanthomonas arboricola]|nr:putative transposase [Xanthomonas sp. 3058]